VIGGFLVFERNLLSPSQAEEQGTMKIETAGFFTVVTFTAFEISAP
jgi:hypothetical protein